MLQGRRRLATGAGRKTTYVSEHISSDRGNFFLSSRGTLSSIELRVLKAFPPTEAGAEQEGVEFSNHFFL